MNKKKLTFKLFSILLMVLMFSFVSCDSDSDDDDDLKNVQAILQAQILSELSQTTTPKEITAEDLVGTT